MSFWRSVIRTYGDSAAFILACPLLALIPVAAELIQHGVEAHIGMYNSAAAAEAVAKHPMRLAFGSVKALTLVLPVYWVIRFISSRDAAFARYLDTHAVRLSLGYVIFEMALVFLSFTLPGSLMAALSAFGAELIIAGLTAAWAVAAPLGNEAVGFRRSVSIMAPNLFWTIGLLIVAMLPLMITHYLLGALAIMGPRVLRWPLLTMDSLLVGGLIVVTISSPYQAAVRAAAKFPTLLVPASK